MRLDLYHMYAEGYNVQYLYNALMIAPKKKNSDLRRMQRFFRSVDLAVRPVCPGDPSIQCTTFSTSGRLTSSSTDSVVSQLSMLS